uniref:Calcium-binding protein 39 n=1 Tax=Timspurckia oligopyrenoides TaxID=708627 RepID=A0A7S0ZG16_9RHOD|mmetsp:Transcript_3857/g.6741  ORF Transcript_3857/g.6741 Transcript_3857/m.6741 type:complete len:414 (+) Transcript_3857:53-1294(+)
MLSSLYTSVFGGSGSSTEISGEQWVDRLRDTTNFAQNTAADHPDYQKSRNDVAQCVSALKLILYPNDATSGPGSSKVESSSATSSPAQKVASIQSVDSSSPSQSSASIGAVNAASSSSDPASQARSLAVLARDEDLLLLLTSNLTVMGFETRKDAVQVFNNLLRQQLASESPPSAASPEASADDNTNEASLVTVLESMAQSGRGTDMICTLMRGYDSHEVALNSGAMLRECIRNETMTKMLLFDPLFWKMFDWVQVSDFDVASDAQSTFKDLMLRHPDVAAEFIESEFDRFFEKYNTLLRSHNYVARRMSLKLLGEMLLERANFNIMTRYISSTDNLKLIMNLLLDNRKNIQYEAFHVFKIFVANPNKTPAVASILRKNKKKMVEYLNNFLRDRDDEQFHEDREMIIEEIQEM